ncbi:MAG: hypothetical protein Fur005_40140 [Roseiflexaceae bacterium]
MAKTHADLQVLIDRMSPRQQLELRLSIVEQAWAAAMQLTSMGSYEAERKCLAVVRHWLEAPTDPASQQALTAELEREQMLQMLGHELQEYAWDVVRATQGTLAAAAEIASDNIAIYGGWANPAARRVDPVRGPRVEAGRAEATAIAWQISVAEALLANQPIPQMHRMPVHLSDPAEILAYIHQELSPQLAYQRGNDHDLGLLLSGEQASQRDRLTMQQILACATLLLPPAAEDHGQRLCLAATPPAPTELGQLPASNLFRRIATARINSLDSGMLHGLLKETLAALYRARICRRQASMALTLLGTGDLPNEPDEQFPLSGLEAFYRTSQRLALCESLRAPQFLRLKQVLVMQALWYAQQVLPVADADRGHRANLAAIDQWLSNMSGQLPHDTLGPMPARTMPEVAMPWQAIQSVTMAAHASDADALLKAIDQAISNAIGALTRTSPTSIYAWPATYRAYDYQQICALLIGAGQTPLFWLGPEELYSLDSLDAAILRMNRTHQGILRWGLLNDILPLLQQGIDALYGALAHQPAMRQLVQCLQQRIAELGNDFAAGVDAEGRLLIGTTTEQARQAAFAEGLEIGNTLSQALYSGMYPCTTPNQFARQTRAVAEYCERLAGLAAYAIADRWRFEYTYALITEQPLPPLPI